jgi:hypothetical protein
MDVTLHGLVNISVESTAFTFRVKELIILILLHWRYNLVWVLDSSMVVS